MPFDVRINWVYYDPETLPVELHEAIKINDLSALDHELSTLPDTFPRQEALNACLKLAMPDAPPDTIEHLLKRGAKLAGRSYRALFHRGDTRIFEVLIASGWDMNANGSEYIPVQ